jgi:hypothetical protein
MRAPAWATLKADTGVIAGIMFKSGPCHGRIYYYTDQDKRRFEQPPHDSLLSDLLYSRLVE